MKEKMSVVKVLKSIISGDILLVMGVHRLFPYILYAFILGWVSIWMSYKAEQTMTLVEANKEEFWKNYYNIGSGKEYRISNYEFECLLLDAIGCPRPEKIFEAKWFTTRNFHGMWYIDGDRLENYLHFRANVPVKEYFKQMAKEIQGARMMRLEGKDILAKMPSLVVLIRTSQ